MNMGTEQKCKAYNDILIRDFDAAQLYWRYYVMPDKDKWIKEAQEYLKNKKKLREKKKNDSDYDKLKAKVSDEEKEIFSFKKNIKMSQKDDRYNYGGSISDSLMSRKQRAICESSEIREKDKVDFSDLIINLKFPSDVRIPSGEKKKVFDEEKMEIVDSSEDEYKALITKKKLRKMAYTDGITINNVHYVNFQRTSSKARTGSCLFIKEEYFETMNNWQNMGIPFEKMDKVDLIGSRSYTSLTSSSIIGTLDIDPNSILLIDEITGEYTQECNVVDVENEHLIVNKKEYTQRTDLWDGQSLADESIFNEGKYVDRQGNEHSYSDKGFLLLRLHFFKSAAFNTKLQKYYKEKGITKVYDRFGTEFDAGKIKIVTTKNSCKIFKFTDIICEYLIPEEKKVTLHELEESEEVKAIKLEKERLVWEWYKDKLKADKEVFGVCKYEKKSKFGNSQQLWYQVLNSLNFSKDELSKLVADQIEEINLMKNHPAFFKRHLDMKPTNRAGKTMMLQLLSVNEDISRTKWYKDYLRAYINDMILKIKSGKIQIPNSDFAVLVANPFEMLRASTGEKVTSSILQDNEVWNSRYQDKEELFGFRSPHIATANCALLKNKKCDEWKWFNFTDRILIINLWGKGAFLSQIWNGSDTDSDLVFCGNNGILLQKVKETVESGKYLIPINGLSPDPDPKEYTDEQMAKVDAKLQNDLIGKICNYARDLQSIYWHLYNTGTEENKEKYLPQICDDICILEVLSNIAIDNAKRTYPVKVNMELEILKKRNYLEEEGIFFKNDALYVTKVGHKEHLYKETIKNIDTYLDHLRKAETEEEKAILNKNIEEELMVERNIRMKPNFTKNLKSKNRKKTSRNKDEYVKLESPMDHLSSIIDEDVKRAKRTKILSICDILEPVCNEKVDYNRVKRIIEIALNGKSNLGEKQKEYNDKKKDLEKFVEERENIIEQTIEDMKIERGKPRVITKSDINKLLHDAYDVRKNRDKRNKKLVENKAGGLMIQWLYEAFPKEFISAIRENKGTVTQVYTVGRNVQPKPNEEVYSLYGKKYVIR